MDWAHERTKLLPRSGVGVVSPWLVVAPQGNPIIRLDLRALDKIRIHTEDDPDESDDSAEPDESDDGVEPDDSDQVVTAAVDPRCNLILVCGELEVALYVADGPEAVDRIVQEAAPLTRESTGLDSAADLSQLLVVGNDPVFQRGEYIQVGSIAFRIGEVRAYALRGANLPLTGGRLLQAAMALLVVAAAERDTPAST